MTKEDFDLAACSVKEQGKGRLKVLFAQLSVLCVNFSELQIVLQSINNLIPGIPMLGNLSQYKFHFFCWWWSCAMHWVNVPQVSSAILIET